MKEEDIWFIVKVVGPIGATRQGVWVGLPLISENLSLL